MKVEMKPIGVIHTPFKELKGIPKQPVAALGIKGTVEIYDPFIPGLKDLESCAHIILLFHLHKSREYKLQLIPYKGKEIRGLFATRAPSRPNPIGLSVVKLTSIEGNLLRIENVDMLDGTPLLDIKPYFPEFAEDKIYHSG